jgi:hypothetical protein
VSVPEPPPPPAASGGGGAPLRLEPVAAEGRSFAAFIRLPDRLYRGRAGYVAPLAMERRQSLSPASNPYFQHAKVQYWLAWRGERPVGRISAQIDDLHLARHGDATGQFGLLDAEDDPAVFAALLTAAEDWLRARGMRRALGPFSLSINEESGLLVEGFDAPPMIMMAYAPPYAAARLVEHGYRKAKDLIAYDCDLRDRLPFDSDELLRRAAVAAGAGRVTVRRVDMRRYRAELAVVLDIFNDAWAENWSFVPFTEAEIRQVGGAMRPLIDPELVWIAEVDGRPACMVVGLPNLYEAIAGLNGRLLPFGWLKLLWRLKVSGVRTSRIVLMGLRRAYHRTALGSVLIFAVFDALRAGGRRHGFERAELSWVLEDNLAMRRLIERVGGQHYKTYRIYEKPLA